MPNSPWGEVIGGRCSLCTQVFVPLERNIKIMNLRAYVGAAGTPGPLPFWRKKERSLLWNMKKSSLGRERKTSGLTLPVV